MTRQRIRATLAAVLMIGALLSACLFLSLHAGHVCHDNRCPVCLRIQACVEQFRTARNVGDALTISPLTPIFRLEILSASVSAPLLHTLVTWKVKLSN